MSTKNPAARLRRAVGGALIVAASLTATACGDDRAGDARPALSATEHNDADVAFATDMIQHHAQALVMVDLTLDRPLDPEVEQLAESIRAAQGPEIETMADWLQDWGEDVPETMRDHSHAGHGESPGGSMDGMDHDMPGMMSAEEMAGLEAASGEEFQTMWLEMMLEHHEGAVEMAREEQDSGRYEPAVELARDIERTQSAEIETIQGLLGDGAS